MRINGLPPSHIARLYGQRPPAGVAPAAPLAPVTPSRAVPSVDPASGAARLVAGQVSGGIDFNGATPQPRATDPVLQLYTRAADKVEAATAVQIGRSVDLRG